MSLEEYENPYNCGKTWPYVAVVAKILVGSCQKIVAQLK